MSDGIYSALSGAIAQQRSLDIVANNVANANTAGFRAERVAFDQALMAERGGENVPREARDKGPVRQAPQALRFVSAERVVTDFEQGTLQQTQNPLDLALRGDGFFAVQTPNGERYTRAGNFGRDIEGVVRMQDGNALLDTQGQTIRVPSTAREIEVLRDGRVMVDGAQLARIKIAQFSDPSTLRKEGDSLFVTSSEPVAAAECEVHQGYLETSNVNPVTGLNELITTSRLFDTFQKIIQGFRDLDNRAARDLGSRT